MVLIVDDLVTTGSSMRRSISAVRALGVAAFGFAFSGGVGMSESPSGGSGGKTRRDVKHTRLIERALREEWPIPASMRRPLIKRLNEIIQDTDSTPREVTSAAKAILTASRLNLEVVTKAIAADQHEDIVRRLSALEERDEYRSPT
jgi:hypothetical protein